MSISAKRVTEILRDCLFTQEELDSTSHPEPVKSEGIRTTFGFHPARLESYRNEVRELLAQLPDDFHQDKGGGMSFLNACMTRDGDQWGEHSNMEELFVLGNALNESAWCMPRDLWSMFPGGMPYVVVKKAG